MLSFYLIGFAFAIVVYLCLVIVMISAFKILETKGINSFKKKHIYIIPAITIISIIFFVSLCYSLSYNLYSYAYSLIGIITGYMFYVFLCCCIYLLLSRAFIFAQKHALIITIGIPLFIGTYSLLKQQFINVDHITLTYPGYQSTTRICHLTDLHLGAIYQKGLVSKVVKRILEEEPDVLVITGDLVDGSLTAKEAWLEPFNLLTIPILFVTGNHEPLMGKEAILGLIAKKTNIKHIGNMTSPVIINNISFIGYDHENNLSNRMNEFSLQQTLSYPIVLLAHSPKNKPNALMKYNIFLQLAGHTHKGQMFPFQPLAWIANTCYYGLYSSSNKKHYVYVSSGVGTALIPMRNMARPEFGIITIKGD